MLLSNDLAAPYAQYYFVLPQRCNLVLSWPGTDKFDPDVCTGSCSQMIFCTFSEVAPNQFSLT